MTGDPFAALGLAASPDLTDDDVRAAWRRVAAATHPDRADGGDPAAFAVAASAYSDLRTRFGRNEALADLRITADRRRLTARWARWARPDSGTARARRGAPGAGWAGWARWAGRNGTGAGWAGWVGWVRRDGVSRAGWAGRVGRNGIPCAGWAGRVRRGQPGRLVLRVAAAVAAGVLVVVIAGWQPATPALMVG
ncbi:MAG: hypothetical protein ACRDRJ_46395, partial [Streptosporangiaceae bacterium]